MKKTKIRNAIILFHFVLLVGCGDLLTSKPIEKALAPTKGIFYIVQQDDTIKILADREIHFLDSSLKDKFTAFKANIVESYKNDLLGEINSINKSLVVISNKISLLPKEVEDQFAIEESNVTKFEADENLKIDINKKLLTEANLNIASYDQKAKSLVSLNQESKSKKDTFDKLTKKIADDILSKINKEISSNGLEVPLLDKSLSDLKYFKHGQYSAHPNFEELIHPRKAGERRSSSDMTQSKVFGADLFKSEKKSGDPEKLTVASARRKTGDWSNYNIGSSMHYHTKDKKNRRTFYFFLNIPEQLSSQLKNEIKSGYSKWAVALAEYNNYSNTNRDKKKRADTNLIPWKNQLSSDFLGRIKTFLYPKIERDMRYDLTRLEKLKVPKIHEFIILYQRHLLSEIENSKLAISATKNSIIDKQEIIQSRLDEAIKPLTLELTQRTEKLAEIQFKYDNVENNLELSSFQIESLFGESSVSSVRTDIDGKFIVPNGAKFIFAKISRLQNEELHWFLEIPDGVDKMELKNSNATSKLQILNMLNQTLN